MKIMLVRSQCFIMETKTYDISCFPAFISKIITNAIIYNAQNHTIFIYRVIVLQRFHSFLHR